MEFVGFERYKCFNCGCKVNVQLFRAGGRVHPEIWECRCGQVDYARIFPTPVPWPEPDLIIIDDCGFSDFREAVSPGQTERNVRRERRCRP